jgi:hypothetical protein
MFIVRLLDRAEFKRTTLNPDARTHADFTASGAEPVAATRPRPLRPAKPVFLPSKTRVPAHFANDTNIVAGFSGTVQQEI